MVAVVGSTYLPDRIFDRVVFAWVALGSAFGPLVFVRLAGFSVAAEGIFASILVGFLCAVGLSLAPNLHPFVQRAGPFFLALFVLLLSIEKAEKT